MNDNTPLIGTHRDAPLHFAGRTEELDALRGYLNYIRHQGNAKDGIVLIDGVQGVGKTQLGRHFAKLAEAEGVRHVAVGAEDLDGPEPDALGRALTDHLRGRVTKFKDFLDEHIKTLPGKAELRHRGGATTSILAATARKAWWNEGEAVLLTVDEIQNVTSEGRRTLRELNGGFHDCPIMVVCMGLQHARNHLAGTLIDRSGLEDNAGISRFALRLTLGALSPEEAVEAVTKGIAAAGQKPPSKRNAEAIADAASCFPQHLHGYIAAALDVVAVQGWSAASMRELMARGHKARTDYYEDRLTAMDDEHRAPILRLATRIERQQMPGSNVSWEAATEMIGRAAVDDAIAKGMLSRALDQSVYFPIPSFHAWALQLAGGASA